MPTHPRLETADPRDPADVAALQSMLDEGFGEFTLGPGEPHRVISADGGTPPPAGPNPSLLARFVHMADFQLADDESPARICFGDSNASSDVNGAFRPHEANLCHMVDALVRAVNRWVVLVSHHATDLLGNGDEIGGALQADAVLEPAWLDIVGSYPNVLFSMVAHAHVNRTRLIGPDGGHQWFEVQTAALADFPHQARLVELYDQDNGWVMLRATAFDFLQDDPIAEDGRHRGIADWVSAWGLDGLAQEGQRNVEMWIQAP